MPVVGWLSRLRRRHRTVVPLGEEWASADDWRSWEAPRNAIVGEQSYQEAIRALAGAPRQNGWLVPVDVLLVREPSNPFDPHAVRAEVSGAQVGYLRREIASHVSRRMQRGRIDRLTVAGVVRGGHRERRTLGVHVWLHRPVGSTAAMRVDDEHWAVPNWPPPAHEGVAHKGKARGGSSS